MNDITERISALVEILGQAQKELASIRVHVSELESTAHFNGSPTADTPAAWEQAKARGYHVFAQHNATGARLFGQVRHHHNGGLCLQTDGACYPVDELSAPWRGMA